MEYECLELIISSSVYEPAEDSFMLAKHAKHLKGHILEIGCGSGIVSLTNAKHNPSNTVIGVDVNPAALTCAKKNAVRNKITNASFKVSNLFSKLEGMHFDHILFNPPYLPTDKETKLKDSRLNKAFDGGKDGRIVLDRFLAEFDKFLKHDGTLLLIHSSLNDLDKTEELLRSKGFHIQILEEQSFFFEKLSLVRAARQKL
jgi:release factor glutamine methyltransferase